MPKNCAASAPRQSGLFRAASASKAISRCATAPICTRASPRACCCNSGHAAYRKEQDVYDAAYAVPWQRWFTVERSIRVDVTAIRSPLKSLDFITLRIKDAACDRFRAECGRRPSVDTRAADVRIAAFLDTHHVTLYLDTSGEPLYKRGYRTERGEAPLKENLAAGILALTGWNTEEPLFDPMCGSGTFVIEAAMMALRIAPGAGRSFGFERLLALRSDAVARPARCGARQGRSSRARCRCSDPIYRGGSCATPTKT